MRRLLQAAALAALAGCASVARIFESPPAPEPATREGWVAYRVADLRVEAPAAWRASGGPRALTLEEPDGQAKLAVSVSEERFQDAKACLAAGDASLQRGAAGLERVRRHASTFAGAPAVEQEADQGAWHGWAWAVCDRGTQYRIFFTAPATAPASVLEVHRALLAARLIGGVS
ncbi:MAG: hypothetical protein QM704_17785 [Anaeromyxobacteraceae bacterium]